MKIVFITKDETLIESVRSFIAEWNSSSDLIFSKTSGSTGTPKRIQLHKKHMIASAKATGAFLNLQEGQRALLCLSPDTIAGKMMLVRSMVLNLDLFVADVSGNPLQNIAESIDFAAMTPYQVAGCVAQSPAKLALIDKLLIGGGPIPEALERHLSTQNLNCFHTYGMTETISHVAMRRIGQGFDSFEALPGITFSESDGCLVIHAPLLGIDKLATNDRVALISPTQFRWLGRADFVINSGGIKIHPEEIERTLGEVITQPFFSTGIPDELLGSKHVLLIEGDVVPALSELIEVIDRYQRPKEIYFIKKFHYTVSGKIDRIATVSHLKDAKKLLL